MFVQFGYAFLFSSVFPMAAFWAVFNNLLEIRADAFKLCKVFQRPPAKSVRNIGAWMVSLCPTGGRRALRGIWDAPVTLMAGLWGWVSHVWATQSAGVSESAAVMVLLLVWWCWCEQTVAS